MKSQLIDLGFTLTEPFMIKEICTPYFTNSRHFHKDFELVLVLESSGKRIIGDHIGNFKRGDMVFMGPNLPHAWFNDKEYYEGNQDLSAKSIVLYFKMEWLRNMVAELPGTAHLKSLMDNAAKGMEIKGKARNRIKELMENIICEGGFKKNIQIFTLLYELSEASDYGLLSNEVNFYDEDEAYRINHVYEYVMKNFSKSIRLSEISNIIHLSPNAFCKYFKAHTQKKFSQFVNEVRISHACKLLQKRELPISQICFESGFQSTTNFNKFFKKIKHTSPLEYRKKFN